MLSYPIVKCTQVYNLESELTMLKGDISKSELSAEKEGIENELKSASNEFVVHVTKHASPPFTGALGTQ